ncbi:hypothetical protein MLD38_002928 [Melastoma candidum]|uniref:Uncharacterized protein n=1 Tax=Melastoma candidum TaxID=119954 RepID=A0ACB9S0F4_9MYRT|nr:hypothetical protein MLD38_002928 [Melastoma candidum]
MKSGGSLDIEEGTGAMGREVKSTSTPTGPPHPCQSLRKQHAVTGSLWTKVSMQQKVLLLLCVASAILDPLFVYIPTINGESFCLELDQKLGITAIVLRSLVDVLYFVLWYFYWRARRGPDTTASKADTEEIPSLQTSSVEQTHKSPGKTNLFSPKKAFEMLSILTLPQVKLWTANWFGISDAGFGTLECLELPNAYSLHCTSEVIRKTMWSLQTVLRK